jgi:transcription antitermination factor NusA-like protein
LERSVKGTELIISRADDGLLRGLFEIEVPEIYNGSVEIKAIAREAGARSKVAVHAIQEGVDPVGSCVGLRGIRIQNIVNELHGEKIDVVQWDENPIVFISQALSPSQVLRVDLLQANLTATAVVPENTLSLAIGKEGQNARLAAKLTGWKVDIKSDTEIAKLEPVKPVKVKPVKVDDAVSKKPVVIQKVTEPVAEVTVDEPESKEKTQDQKTSDALKSVDAPVTSDAKTITGDSAEKQEVLEAVADLDNEPKAQEVTNEQLEPVKSAAELSEEVWNIRKPPAPVDPGQIRFAEDIAELHKNGPSKRKGTRKRRPNTGRTTRRK